MNASSSSDPELLMLDTNGARCGIGSATLRPLVEMQNIFWIHKQISICLCHTHPKVCAAMAAINQRMAQYMEASAKAPALQFGPPAVFEHCTLLPKF